MKTGIIERTFQVIGRSIPAVCIFALCLLFASAVHVRADGEIIILPGEKYMIPCLAQTVNGQEYDIAIENPDIVGLDETGKCIVGVAVGTTEVTVRLMNPDSAYTYVFAVAENWAEPYADAIDPATDYYDYDGLQSGNEFYIPYYESSAAQSEGNHDGGQADSGANAGQEQERPDTLADAGQGQSMPDSVADAGQEEKEPDTGTNVGEEESLPDTGAGAGEEESLPDTAADTGQEEMEPDTGTDVGWEETEPDTGTDARREETEPDIGTDAMREQNESENGEKTDETSYADRFRQYPPVTFSHGTGIYDILVPDHYTLWICAHSSGPVSVLYVGADGVPIPYRADGNMIYIDSSDLPAGCSVIQVLTVDAAGRVAALKGYGIVR